MPTIEFRGTPTHLIGQLPDLGSKAPDFTLTKTDLGELHLKHYLGTRVILNIFPSLDTATCAAAMREFNKIASEYPNTLVLCVSADLPFAQKRFCSAEHLENVMPASVFRHPNFGKTYGVTITDGPLAGLLSRTVFVIDKNGKVAYIQQVKEITEEPDYAAIRKVLRLE